MKQIIYSLFGLILTSTVLLAQQSDLQTQSFEPNAIGHELMDSILRLESQRNVLAFPSTQRGIAEGIPADQVPMLTDNSAGVWVGDGRVWVGGTPATVVYKLQKEIKLDEIRFFTSNSDQRANQDFEVILSNSNGDSLVLSSGDKVLGNNNAPFFTTIPVKSDKCFNSVTFRIWNSYGASAGSPAKAQSRARDWCSVVELQALADFNDPRLFANEQERREWLAMHDAAIEAAKEAARIDKLNAITRGAAGSIPAFKRGLEDLYNTYPEKYNKTQFKQEFESISKQLDEFLVNYNEKDNAAVDKLNAVLDQYESLRRKVLLSNPLLDDFSELMIVRRSYKSPRMGLPCNWESNSSLPKGGFDDAIVTIPVKSDSTTLNPSQIKMVFKPKKPYFVGDVDLNWDADKILFSSVGENNRWQVFEYNLDGKSEPKDLTCEQPDVDSYDACYLPDGRIAYTATSIMAGVPCVYGSSHIATLFLMNADGSAKRQLAFDQEHSWNPSVLNNGQILYERWEYTDLPHSNSRQLFHCNPDGTGQLSYYSSNSYWPNSLWNSRAIPGQSSMIVSVITGHHDSHRAGELCIFDPALGRNEADGCIQRIPGWGKKVVPIIKDGLVGASWPKFLHPYPLSEKYFIVSSKPTPSSKWGLYLVDVFDNMTLLYEDNDYALLEPLPLRKKDRPYAIPDRVDLSSKEADVYIADVYNGPGLKDVPRGTIKQLRLFTYHFSYQNMGGLMGIVGVDGPWDIKEVLGTVPVNPDGSARFKVPANTPISLQPLDESGQTLQLMRSWLTAMPGEILQCNGCHEDQNQAAIPRTSTGFRATPAEITPWFGDRRGFAYPREVQPIIDKYCLACHDGSKADCKTIDLRGDVFVQQYHSIQPGQGTGYVNRNAHFSVGYYHLQKYVRRSGIESDMHLLEPKEFASDTTELVQLLRQGHHGVRLSEQGWDRLLTWIDLNCPYHGTWAEATKNPGTQRNRRIELAKLYANLDPHDAEAIIKTDIETGDPIMPSDQLRQQDEKSADKVEIAVNNFTPETKSIQLPNGDKIDFVRIPAGKYTVNGKTVTVDKPYWISTKEISNVQFNQFNPLHDSRVESKHCYQFGIHGYPVNRPEQPVCRVTQQSAEAFCNWLSKQSNVKATLPTEFQWEWAARAGANTDFFYGDINADFGKFANLSDASMRDFATNPYTVNGKYGNIPEFDDWIPSDKRFNDGQVLPIQPGSYQPNSWGLYDVHGNVAEWTRTLDAQGKAVVKGGSWYDRPYRAAFGASRSYPTWQRVFDVGFRVVIEE